MAVAKVILNGTTLIDVTQKTVTSGSMTSGTTALKNDGTDIVGSIATKSSADLSVSGATVTVPSGYYAEAETASVATGTAGTPSATKGTVSNHSVSVTPSVTNVAGYITGGTKTGTAVTVSASELVSGTYNVNASGTANVTNYASISVPSGSATTPATTITANPTISVSATGLITASVSGSQGVTPTVSAGYVSSGTAGTVSVSGSATQQLTVYNGSHHYVAPPAPSGYTVTISLTNPISSAYFNRFTIYESETAGVKGELLGSILSPTGSTEVFVDDSLYGIYIELVGGYMSFGDYNITCSSGISVYNYQGDGSGVNFAAFEVTDDGTIVFDSVDWDD